VEKLPYSYYHEMLNQAINQGAWRGGSKLKLNKDDGETDTKGDPVDDFWKLARKGEIEWICKDCLKLNGTMGKEKECTCENISTESTSV